MKKFVYLFADVAEPSGDVHAQWEAWFTAVGPNLVDSGNPFGSGRELTAAGSRELTAAHDPAAGYTIVAAESLDDAEALLAGCPAHRVRIYEALPM